jgi:hypothetical protein
MGVSQGALAVPPIEKVRGRVLNNEKYLKRLLTGVKIFEASPNFTLDDQFTHVLFHPNKTLRDRGFNTNVLAQCEPALCGKKFSPDEVAILTNNGKHLGMDSKEELKRYARGRALALFPVLKPLDTTGIMVWNDSLGRTANQQGFLRARLPCGQLLFDYIGRQCVSCHSLTAVAGDNVLKPLSLSPDTSGPDTSSDITKHLRKRYVC